ncbi:hypothetical protein DE146DRAFT_629705 [Phaeosphaeria sp. MPI-PUGE-AT-0046c]|nr:hypothetical protein DE146DRAFT_629705 [Phaeosphaeria sp. MPI-PUGE-AT-0046c]
MTNIGNSFYTSPPQWAVDGVNVSSISQRSDVVHDMDHELHHHFEPQQFDRHFAAHDEPFHPALLSQFPDLIEQHAQDDYLDGFANLEHMAAFPPYQAFAARSYTGVSQEGRIEVPRESVPTQHARISNASQSDPSKLSRGVESADSEFFQQFQVEVEADIDATAHPNPHQLLNATGELMTTQYVRNHHIPALRRTQEATEHAAASDANQSQAKRKIHDTVEDDIDDNSHINKKAKHHEKMEDTKVESIHRGKKAVKAGRPAKLERNEELILPDYGNTVLQFASGDAALISLQNRLNTIKGSFIALGEDSTIPQNDEQIKDAVKTVLGAIKDVAHAKDSNSRAFKSRWVDNAQHPYSDEVLETTSWRIVNLCVKLHREGPSALSIGDPHYLPQIKKSAHLKFADRIKTIATLLIEWKARCDGVIKGDTLQTVVAAPIEAFKSAGSNSVGNKTRANRIKLGGERELQEQGNRKRKATADAPGGVPKTPTRKRKQSNKQNADAHNSMVTEDNVGDQGMIAGDDAFASTNADMVDGIDAEGETANGLD